MFMAFDCDCLGVLLIGFGVLCTSGFGCGWLLVCCFWFVVFVCCGGWLRI